MALARQTQELKLIATRPLHYLNTAIDQLNAQGIDPWVLFARIHTAKALSDVDDIESAGRILDELRPMINRFPVFASHAEEAVGQIQSTIGNSGATASLRKAIASATTSGLMLRCDLLEQNYKPHIGGSI